MPGSGNDTPGGTRKPCRLVAGDNMLGIRDDMPGSSDTLPGSRGTMPSVAAGDDMYITCRIVKTCRVMETPYR